MNTMKRFHDPLRLGIAHAKRSVLLLVKHAKARHAERPDAVEALEQLAADVQAWEPGL